MGYLIINGNWKCNRGVSYARNKCLEYLLPKCDYILFIDSDDMIEGNYLYRILEVVNSNYDIIESNFFINGKYKEYKDKIRTHCSGQAIKSNLINDIRFDETLQIGEDSKFMIDIHNKIGISIKRINTSYFYNLGLNKKSLIMRYMRHEIEKRI